MIGIAYKVFIQRLDKLMPNEFWRELRFQLDSADYTRNFLRRYVYDVRLV